MAKIAVEIIIDPDTGFVTTQVEGVEGPACEELVGWLDELGENVEHKHTADFHKRPRLLAREGRVRVRR